MISSISSARDLGIAISSAILLITLINVSFYVMYIWTKMNEIKLNFISLLSFNHCYCIREM